MMLLEVLVLAIVQGVAEFLPISSSGHIVVGAALFDQFGDSVQDKLTLNIVLHVGTLAAICVFYWQRIWRLLSVDRRMIPLLVTGTLPAVFVGLTMKGTAWGTHIEAALENPLVAGWMFPITGLMLLWAARRDQGETLCRDMSFRSALLIGVLQAFAILPGISRSGATIVAGLGCGLRRKEAATFSFLLAIPAIAGGALLEGIKLIRHGPSPTPVSFLAIGATVAFLVGLIALWWLIRWLDQGRLVRFAWYLIPLGIAVVAWQIVG